MRKFMLLTILLLIQFPATVSAHVVISDDKNTSGVTYHATPDDDPIAGSETELFFDVQNKDYNTEKFIYFLHVFDNSGTEDFVNTEVLGEQSLVARYTFPVQGKYNLRLTGEYKESSNEDKPVPKFDFEQEVTRGTENVEPNAGNSIVLSATMVLVVIFALAGLAVWLYKKSKK